jgi:hypothetical protein
MGIALVCFIWRENMSLCKLNGADFCALFDAMGCRLSFTQVTRAKWSDRERGHLNDKSPSDIRTYHTGFVLELVPRISPGPASRPKSDYEKNK